MIIPTQDKKGAFLAISIIIVFFSIIILLQSMALRILVPPKALVGAAGLVGGIDVYGFTVTAYCPGSCCNGVWAGLTATGKSIDYYRARKINIAAVDPSVIPMRTRLTYGGREYLAVDIGGKIRGRKIDLLMPSHRETCLFGVKKDQYIRILSGMPRETTRRNEGSEETMGIADLPDRSIRRGVIPSSEMSNDTWSGSKDASKN
jgi:3D (Asp-Asp-Asp) domain-containing protein